MGGVIHRMTATNWKNGSTYVQHKEHVFPDLGPMGTEDSFIYADPKGRLHAVFHHMFGLPWPEDIERWWLLAGTGHAFSEDLGAKWTYTGLAISNYSGNALHEGINILFDDGWRWYSRQESPMLIFGDNTKMPTHLVTAVGTGDGSCATVSCANKQDGSYTLVQPLEFLGGAAAFVV